jgi:GT2 family glycosyltransferase
MPDDGMSTLCDVSVIVIANNVREELGVCLRSIAEHSGGQAVETILVDNGSSDGTVAAVAEHFPDTQIVALDRNEGGSARNHGLRIARGRYIAFLDSDAQLTEGALDDLVAFMDEHPDIGLVGPRLVYPDGGPQPSARRFPPLLLPFLRRKPLSRWFENGAIVRRHLMLDVPIDGTREAEYVIGACQLFSAVAQKRIGELDPRIPFAPEDIDWCVRMRLAGFRIAYRPEASVIHGYRRTTAQRQLSRKALDHAFGFAYFQWKWRRSRRALRAQAAAMEQRGWRLEGARPAPAGSAASHPGGAEPLRWS